MHTGAVEFDDRGPSIDEPTIDALENQLGIRLPDDYRAFLLAVNGGRPRGCEAFDIDDNDTSLLDVLYSVGHDDEDYSLAWRRLVFEQRVPADLLPIGHDQGGNLICLRIGDEDHGQVVFWDMEYEGERPTYDNVYPVAESFAAFLDSLYCDED